MAGETDAMQCMRAQVVENWTFSLFFCVAELWGAVVISVLFWTLANEARPLLLGPSTVPTPCRAPAA